MDALLQEIAKTFNIGNDAIQNIIESYPQLRQQIATYNFMEVIRTLMVIIGASSFFAFAFSTFVGIVQAVEYAQPSYSENDDDLYAGNWKGQNLLGKALMEVRDKLKQ